MDSPDHSATRLQQQCNRKTRGNRDSFEPHRQKVTSILVTACQRDQTGGPTVLILGVGNGNDVDLDTIAACCRSITLADLDIEAVNHCVSKLSPATQEKINIVAPVDLSGVFDQLPESGSPSGSLQEVIAAAQSPSVKPKVESADIVVSTCLMSQLIDSVHQSVGESHPDYLPLVLAVRDGHLNLLRRLSKPGGKTILITDFVSSDTLPQLTQVHDQQLMSLLTQSVEQRNFFTGLNPAVLIQKLSGDTPLAPEAVHPPWRWHMGPRVFGVIAIETQWL